MFTSHYNYNYAIVANILIIYALTITANKLIEMETITCQHNASTFLSDVTCGIRLDTDNITKVSLSINLLKQIDDFDVRHIFELSRNKMARMKVLDMRINVCSFLKSANKQKILEIFKQQLEAVLNVVPTCPMPAPFNYTFTDYYMDVKFVPKNFPAANFRSMFFVYVRNRLILTIMATGKITD